MFSRNARLYLATAALMGFTIFGGIYSLLLNLYLLRLGYGLPFIGSVNAAALLGWAVACLLAGPLCRKLGTRRAMVIGMTACMLGYLLVPFCEVVPAGRARAAWLLSSYLFGNVAISLYDVSSQPFLVESSSPTERNHLFSIQAALWPLAAFLGSLLGGLLPGLFSGILGTTTEDPGPYRFPLMAAAATLAVAALVLSRTSTSHPDPAPRATLVPASARGGLLLIVLVGALMFLHGSGEGTAKTFFNVYLDAELRSPTLQIGIVVAAAQLVAVPAALLMPAAVRRWGHRRVFLWGTVGIALGFLPLALVPHWAAAGLGYMIVMAFVALTRAAVMVYLMGIFPESQRTTMAGVYTMAIGLSWSAAAAGGSRLITASGYPVFYLAGAALTLASVAVFGFLIRPASGS